MYKWDLWDWVLLLGIVVTISGGVGFVGYGWINTQSIHLNFGWIILTIAISLCGYSYYKRQHRNQDKPVLELDDEKSIRQQGLFQENTRDIWIYINNVGNGPALNVLLDIRFPTQELDVVSHNVSSIIPEEDPSRLVLVDRDATSSWTFFPVPEFQYDMHVWRVMEVDEPVKVGVKYQDIHGNVYEKEHSVNAVD